MIRSDTGGGVRLKDIARHSNLSLATVSRVLRGSGIERFSPDTRQRVTDAARELGWVPNRLVQGIQTGRTGTVGILAVPLAGHWHRLLDSAHTELLAHDAAPLSLYPRYESAGTTELAQLRQMMERRVDAIACWPLVDAAAMRYLVDLCAKQVPVVAIDFDFSDPGTRTSSVRTSESCGMNLSVDHLFRLGHRRIGYVGPQSDDAWAVRRRDAFTAAVRERRLKDTKVEAVPKHQLSAREGMRRVLSSVSAVIVGSEQLALLAYEMARELSLVVPAELSIVSFGQPQADFPIWPEFTFVDQRPELLGKRVAELLLSAGAARSPVYVDVDPQLVAGQTTAPPKSGG
jgi:LacI family transcriptional regulator